MFVTKKKGYCYDNCADQNAIKRDWT